ncbi:MAG: dihydroneopterin aldolase [Chthoniobacterales bacterium]
MYSASNPPGDCIHIEQLEVFAFIGVTDTERAQRQRLTITTTIWPATDFGALADEIARTIDYSAVCEATRKYVAGRADKLIETLADSLARDLLAMFPIRSIAVEVRKFVIADTEYVSVRLTRDRLP